MSTFHSDLSFGQSYELKSLEYLKHDSYEIMEGYHKEYDLTITRNGKTRTIEVKADRLAAKTGNIALEYRCNCKPSGIKTTTADYWVIFVVPPKGGMDGSTERCYKIPTKKLRELAKGGRKVKGGDRNASRMRLVPLKSLDKYLISRHKRSVTPYIRPTMSDREGKDSDRQPTYTERLIEVFDEHAQDTFSRDQVKQVIEEFARVESEKRRASCKVLPFGKYRYKKVRDIAKIDRQYLQWLMKQSFMESYPDLMTELKRHVRS